MTADNHKLEPCPFCCGEASYSEHKDAFENWESTLSCEGCGAGFRCHHYDSDERDLRAIFTAAWNRRSPPLRPMEGAMGSEPQAAAANPKTELEQLREEVANFKSWGIIGIAVRNPNVSEYMQHWEGRATKAEAELATLQQRVDELTREGDAYAQHSVENSMRAFNWMAAHDALKAGVPYNYPTPADLPNAIVRAEAAEARVSELEAEVREAKEALDGACAQILDSYRIWVADNCDAHPRPGQIPRYDRARTTLTRLTTLSDRKAEGGAK